MTGSEVFEMQKLMDNETDKTKVLVITPELSGFCRVVFCLLCFGLFLAFIVFILSYSTSFCSSVL